MDFNDRTIYDGVDVTLPKNSSVTVANKASLDLVGEVKINGSKLSTWVVMTQAVYDGHVPDPNVLYIIIG